VLRVLPAPLVSCLALPPSLPRGRHCHFSFIQYTACL